MVIDSYFLERLCLHHDEILFVGLQVLAFTFSIANYSQY